MPKASLVCYQVLGQPGLHLSNTTAEAGACCVHPQSESSWDSRGQQDGPVDKMLDEQA